MGESAGDEDKFGFMPGKGTTVAVEIVRQMMEKHLAKKKQLYLGFVDPERAFDRVPNSEGGDEMGHGEVGCGGVAGTDGDGIV